MNRPVAALTLAAGPTSCGSTRTRGRIAAAVEFEIHVLPDLQVLQCQRFAVQEIGPAFQDRPAVVVAHAVDDHTAQAGEGTGNDAGAAGTDAATVDGDIQATATGQQQRDARRDAKTRRRSFMTL